MYVNKNAMPSSRGRAAATMVREGGIRGGGGAREGCL